MLCAHTQPRIRPDAVVTAVFNGCSTWLERPKMTEPTEPGRRLRRTIRLSQIVGHGLHRRPSFRFISTRSISPTWPTRSNRSTQLKMKLKKSLQSNSPKWPDPFTQRAAAKVQP